MACDNCGNGRGNRKLTNEHICDNCFEQKFGELIEHAGMTWYYGGDSNFPTSSDTALGKAGRLFLYGKADIKIGHFFLTENNVIVTNIKNRDNNKSDLVIPFDSIILDFWDTEELIIPYVDKNEKMQKPKFRVEPTVSNIISRRRFNKKVIEKLNQLLIDFQQKKLFEKSKKPAEEKSDSDKQDKAQELYDKLEKGEITMKEYEDELGLMEK